jgi:hypothetical protein
MVGLNSLIDIRGKDKQNAGMQEPQRRNGAKIREEFFLEALI